MDENTEFLTTTQKALTINRDAPKYGTFAEIGAGQEVAREFFHAGGASGTIAKSISAYDMVFSDAIYGKAPRCVSREGLNSCWTTNTNFSSKDLGRRAASGRLSSSLQIQLRPAFTKARTKRTAGWESDLQIEPKGEPSEIVLHVRMWDKEAALQQQAVALSAST